MFGAAIAALQACAMSEPIMTDEKFEYRELENGPVEFIFGVSWRNTSASSLLNGREEDPRSIGGKGRPEQGPYRQQFAIQADNETKLKLEDEAAESLKKRLKKEKLCPESYEITQVMWRNDNIRLLGHCL